jgi:hypothetical protein
MLGFAKASAFAAALAAGAVLLAGTTAPSYADTGTVRFSVGSAGFIVGVGGGSGTLNFRGRTYQLSIGGINAGTIGVSRADFVGTARNMRRAEDIVGTYSAIGSGIVVAGGAGAARLQNANGVILDLRARKIGFQASLNVGGVTISMR